MKHRISWLTVLFAMAFLHGFGQHGLPIHTDTVKFVGDSVQRYEGRNGKVLGPVTRHFLKQSYDIEPGYNRLFKEDGTIYFEGEYVRLNGSALVEKGLFKFYSKRGQLDYTHDFDSNYRVYYFNDGTKRSDGFTDDAQERTGRWTCYYPGGVIKSTGKVKGSLKYGEWRYFNEKGDLTRKKKYKRWTGTSIADCCEW
jgi:antitoxin component YwqK of YwqJK toxin-antitoxin module